MPKLHPDLPVAVWVFVGEIQGVHVAEMTSNRVAPNGIVTQSRVGCGIADALRMVAEAYDLMAEEGDDGPA